MAVLIPVSLVAVAVIVLMLKVVALDRQVREQAEQIRGLDRGVDVSLTTLRDQAELDGTRISHLAARVTDLEFDSAPNKATSDITSTLINAVTASNERLAGILEAQVVPRTTAQPAEDPTSADDRGPGVPYVDDRDWSDDFIGRPPGAIPGLPDELRGVDPA